MNPLNNQNKIQIQKYYKTNINKILFFIKKI